MMRGASGAAAALTACALGLGALPAHADSYRCTVDGKTIIGATLPPQCAGHPTYRILPDGRSELLEPDLTPEQQRARDAAEKPQRDARERARERMRRDYWLLDRYRSADEIEAERDRELAALQARINVARKALEAIERERTRLQQEVEFYAKRDLPASLRSAIEVNVARRVAQEKIRDDAIEAMTRVNEDYDARRTRYLELTQPPGTRGNAPAPKK